MKQETPSVMTKSLSELQDADAVERAYRHWFDNERLAHNNTWDREPDAFKAGFAAALTLSKEAEAEAERYRKAIEYAHRQGFGWLFDPFVAGEAQ